MNTTTHQTIEVRDIALSLIEADADQPRKRFDAVELDELAASLQSVGLLEPIIVRPAGLTFERYIIVAGERRYRAAIAAGWTRIPAIVRDVEGAEAFALSMIENVVRADMNPIEEAAGYAKLLDAGLDVATIAKRIGKSAAAITARLALLKLAQPVADLVAAGQVDGFVAMHLARLTSEGQYRVIAAVNRGAVEGPLETARLCSSIAAQEAAMPAFDGWAIADAAPTVLAVMPVRDDRAAALAENLDRARAALAAAVDAIDAGVAGDLAGIGELVVLAATVQKAARQRHADRLAATC